MAMFSRRTVQQLIDAGSGFLSPQELLRELRNLDACSDKTIPAEWELAVLDAFSKLGTVSAEPETGATRPDLVFTPRDSQQFIPLEIGVVSDKHLHEKNPFDQFMDAFENRVREAFPQGRPGRFDLDVRQLSPLPVYRGARVTRRLRLPQPHEFKRTIFNRGFENFLASIKGAPDQRREYSVKNDEAEVSIRFDPNSRGTSAGHPVYTLAHHKTSNPVANVLHGKAQQLRSSNLPGPYGIVLCDGDCDLMSRRHSNDLSSFSLDEIVRNFLRVNSSIAFVSVLTIVADNSGLIGPRHLRLSQRIYQNDAFESLDRAIKQCLLNFHLHLPPPARTPVNAHNHLDWLLKTGKAEEGDSFIGGYSMRGQTLKISLRVIQELLAGRTDCIPLNSYTASE
jgi:hypothetical protein